MPKTVQKRRGPYTKKVNVLKTALEWCDSALRDPLIDATTKEKIAATVFRYETTRTARSATAVAGKKDVRAEAAKEAAKAAYAPPASPPRLVA